MLKLICFEYIHYVFYVYFVIPKPSFFNFAYKDGPVDKVCSIIFFLINTMRSIVIVFFILSSGLDLILFLPKIWWKLNVLMLIDYIMIEVSLYCLINHLCLRIYYLLHSIFISLYVRLQDNPFTVRQSLFAFGKTIFDC